MAFHTEHAQHTHYFKLLNLRNAIMPMNQMQSLVSPTNGEPQARYLQPYHVKVDCLRGQLNNWMAPSHVLRAPAIQRHMLPRAYI